MTSYTKVEKIAEACNVDAQLRWEQRRQVIDLYGCAQDIRKVLEQIDGYHVMWHNADVGAPMPEGEEKTVFSLYSGRANWAKLGY